MFETTTNLGCESQNNLLWLLDISCLFQQHVASDVRKYIDKKTRNQNEVDTVGGKDEASEELKEAGMGPSLGGVEAVGDTEVIWDMLQFSCASEAAVDTAA